MEKEVLFARDDAARSSHIEFGFFRPHYASISSQNGDYNHAAPSGSFHRGPHPLECWFGCPDSGYVACGFLALAIFHEDLL